MRRDVVHVKSKATMILVGPLPILCAHDRSRAEACRAIGVIATIRKLDVVPVHGSGVAHDAIQDLLAVLELAHLAFQPLDSVV
jgi:hypothetical protein